MLLLYGPCLMRFQDIPLACFDTLFEERLCFLSSLELLVVLGTYFHMLRLHLLVFFLQTINVVHEIHQVLLEILGQL